MPFINQAVVTLGTFDGVHKAHCAILKQVCTLAENIKGKSTVISFASHPRKVIDPDFTLNILSTTKEKNNLLQQIGIENIVYIDFTASLAQTNYAEFVKLLTKKMEIKKIVLGYNHNFGKNKEGNINSLTELIPEYGFDIVEIPQQIVNNIKISSSNIRKAIKEGNFHLANSLLGYNYTIETVISSVNKDYITLMPINKEKILPEKGKYKVNIDNQTTLLEINDDIYIKNENMSVKNENEIKIQFIDDKNK